MTYDEMLETLATLGQQAPVREVGVIALCLAGLCCTADPQAEAHVWMLTEISMRIAKTERQRLMAHRVLNGQVAPPADS